MKTKKIKIIEDEWGRFNYSTEWGSEYNHQLNRVIDGFIKGKFKLDADDKFFRGLILVPVILVMMIVGLECI